MILNQKHNDFKKYCKRLLGKTISNIEYAEIDYQKLNKKSIQKPHYLTHFPNLDTIDFSIFLYTDTGEKIEIYWDDEFFQYGIGIKINEPSIFIDFKIWNVSNNSIWDKTINKTIEHIKVNWEEVLTTEEKSGKTENIMYPQYITITFSNGKNIFISASGFLNAKDDEVVGMLDNLTVTNDEELARQTKMIN